MNSTLTQQQKPPENHGRQQQTNPRQWGLRQKRPRPRPWSFTLDGSRTTPLFVLGRRVIGERKRRRREPSHLEGEMTLIDILSLKGRVLIGCRQLMIPVILDVLENVVLAK